MSEKELTGYPSIDKPWLKYYTEEDLKIKTPECTIYQNIYECNKEYPDDTAIQYYGNKIKYSTLFERVTQCAKSLRQIGIGKGDCVTLCTAGVPEAIYTVLACSRIGAIANFINPMFTTEQMIDRINDTEAEWIFILDAMYSYIEKALSKTCIKNVVIIPTTNSVQPVMSKILYYKSDARKIMGSHGNDVQKYFLWKEFIHMGADYTERIDVPYEKDTPTIMVYSSGTTGASKGILLTNDGIHATTDFYRTSGYQFDRKMTMLQMIPVWYSTGIVFSMLIPLALCITVIPEPKFSKESFINDIRRYKPSMTITATSLWIHMVNTLSSKEIDLSDMKYPITGGEKILNQDEFRINKFLKEGGCTNKLYKGYGMCELGSTITGTSDAGGYVDKLGGCGIPILNAVVSAFDIDTDEELKYGEHGEIRVCSPARMKGYYKNPEATAAFFKTDERGNVWGCTGDIGYVDEDGEVFILGRATDCYKNKEGETKYLFDIEEHIFADEAVNQCKVVDIDEGGETKLVAHIVFREETTDTTDHIKHIRQVLAEKLPKDMQPDYYKIRTSMPVHSNGKRDVEALRMVHEGLLLDS